MLGIPSKALFETGNETALHDLSRLKSAHLNSICQKYIYHGFQLKITIMKMTFPRIKCFS